MKKLFIQEGRISMMIRQVLSATVVLLGTGIVAHSGDLSTGAIYGSPAQTRAVCYVFNARQVPLTINSIKIFQQFGGGTPLPTNGNDCLTVFNNILPPGEMCGFGAAINNDRGHSCIVDVQGSVARVRGVLEIRDAFDAVLNSSNLY